MLSGLLLLVTGILFVYLGGRNVFQYRDATRWPTGKGVIIRSETKALEHAENSSTVIADIEYEYKVSGVRFTGTQIYLGTTRNSLSLFSQQVVRQFPVGREVTVHYNPAQTAVSFLETDAVIHVFILPAAGLVLALSGFFLLALTLSRWD